jgi:hypothetical protein
MASKDRSERGRSWGPKAAEAVVSTESKTESSELPTSPSQDVHTLLQTTHNTSQFPNQERRFRSSSGPAVRPAAESSRVRAIQEKLFAQGITTFPTTSSSKPSPITKERKEPWEPKDERIIREVRKPRSMSSMYVTPVWPSPRVESGGAQDFLWDEQSIVMSESATEDAAEYLGVGLGEDAGKDAGEQQSRNSSTSDYTEQPLSAQEQDLKRAQQNNVYKENTPSVSPAEQHQQPSEPCTSPRDQSHQFDHLPPGIYAFEYALAPFFAKYPSYRSQMEPPSPTDCSTPVSFSSPPGSPSSLDSSIASQEFIHSPAEDNLPAIIVKKHTLRTRIKILHILTLLTRCSIIQTLASQLEYSSWKEGSASAYKEYSKMYKAADAALSMAQELRSDGLRARCYFWRGRACGGQQNWNEGVSAFEKAMQFDTATTVGNAGDDRKTGLTAVERAEVKFLKCSVEKRARYDVAERKQRWKRDEERAWKIVAGTDQDFEEVIVWTKSPPWRPDMEGIMRQWMQATGRREQTARLSPVLGSDGEWKSNNVDDAEEEVRWAGRALTPNEINYIENGDKRKEPLLRWHDRAQNLGNRRRQPPLQPIRVGSRKSSELGSAVQVEPAGGDGRCDMLTGTPKTATLFASLASLFDKASPTSGVASPLVGEERESIR